VYERTQENRGTQDKGGYVTAVGGLSDEYKAPVSFQIPIYNGINN